MSDHDEDWLAGVTSMSHEEVARRLARTCAIVRETSPEHAPRVLAEMVVLWSRSAGADRAKHL